MFPKVKYFTMCFAIICGVFSTPSIGLASNWQRFEADMTDPNCNNLIFYRKKISENNWEVQYLSRTLVLSANDPFAIVAYKDGGYDTLSLTFHFVGKETENPEKCLEQVRFEYQNISELLPLSTKFKFFSDSNSYYSEFRGSQDLDFFRQSQWIHAYFSGKNLFSEIRSGRSLFGDLFKGILIWELDDGTTVRSPFQVGPELEELLLLNLPR